MMDHNKLSKVKGFMGQQLRALDEIDEIVKHDAKFREDHPGTEELGTGSLTQYTGLMRAACQETLALIARYEPMFKSAAGDKKTTAATTTTPAATVKATPAKSAVRSAKKPTLEQPDIFGDELEEEAGVEERHCRVCGCTEDNACEGGCSWVEDDLCSACAEKEGGDEE
jgi:hypothetical protein